MKNVKEKLRVVHFPQVGSCKDFFSVEVKDEEQALLIVNTLAHQHLWLEKNKIIPDYSNAIWVEMFDESDGWCDYYNREEDMKWEEFEEAYLTPTP